MLEPPAFCKVVAAMYGTGGRAKAPGVPSCSAAS